MEQDGTVILLALGTSDEIIKPAGANPIKLSFEVITLNFGVNKIFAKISVSQNWVFTKQDKIRHF